MILSVVKLVPLFLHGNSFQKHRLLEILQLAIALSLHTMKSKTKGYIGFQISKKYPEEEKLDCRPGVSY